MIRLLCGAVAVATLAGCAAQCLVRHGRRSASLYGVVPGRQPQRAITITGPSEDRERGQLHGPPQVP